MKKKMKVYDYYGSPYPFWMARYGEGGELVAPNVKEAVKKLKRFKYLVVFKHNTKHAYYVRGGRSIPPQ